jgi:hypothetical protein
MSTKDEIMRGMFELLAEIAEREKKDAIDADEYIDAAFLQIFESLLKGARNSLN